MFLVWQGAQHVQQLAPGTRPAATAPSVLLVTIDTLRADRVGAYGYEAARTPNLDALAKRGALFRNAFAHSMFTGPSHASVLSGRTPVSTGFLVNHQGLDTKVETLAEAFGRAGYVTAAFPSSYTTIQRSSRLPGRFQFSDGDLREHRDFPETVYRCVVVRPLEPYLKGPSTWPSYRPARATTDLAIRFANAHAAIPTFTWVHYFDPHVPYAPPQELRAPDAATVDGDWYKLTAEERRALVRDPAKLKAMHGLYDAYVDRELGRLLETARNTAPAGGLLVVVTADHGEPMGEHGHYWYRDLYDPTLHVPLVIAAQATLRSAPRAVNDVVRLIDVAPTMLDLVGLPKLAHAEGISLRALMDGSGTGSPGPAIAVHEPEPDAYAGRWVAVRRGDWKLIRRADDLWALDQWSKGGLELFNLSADPGELANLADAQPEVAQELLQILPKEWAPPAPMEVTPEDRERLRALGYML
jgi:arylsulfatase A-like enzyme